MRYFREPVRVGIKAVVKRCGNELILVRIVSFLPQHFPNDCGTAAEFVVDIGKLIVCLDQLSVVVDDGNLLCLCLGNVLLAILAIDRDQQVRLLLSTDKGHILDRDLKLLDHDRKITLFDLIAASVDKSDVFPVLLEIPLQRIT